MKKTLSILLSLLMVLSVMPFTMMSASADTTEYAYATLADWDNGSANSHVTGDWNGTLSYTDGMLKAINKPLNYNNGGAEFMTLKFSKEELSNSLGFRIWVSSDGSAYSKASFKYTITVNGKQENYRTQGGSVPTANGHWMTVMWGNVDAKGLNWYHEGSSNWAYEVQSLEFIQSLSSLSIKCNSVVTANKDNQVYYFDNLQMIYPAVTVTIDGKDIVGYAGQKITLPQPEDEKVIAYADGDKLYYPGDEYVITGEKELINIKVIIDEESDHDFVFDIEDKTYTGSEICPAVTSATLVEGEDYTVEYENNVNVGTATIKVLGTGNCFIGLSETFTINRKEFEASDFTLAADGLVYTGEEIKPVVSSDIFTEEDYEVSYENNIDAGEDAYAIVSAKDGNGYGAVEIPFSILQKEITEDMFKFDLENKTYTGIEITPEVTSETLELNADYTVGYSSVIDVGTANLYVQGIGNYCGRIDKTFNIVPKEITEADFTVDTESKVYTAKEICPEVTSTLGENDYEVAYENNVDTGSATITVTGTGNYGGTLTYEFVILQKEIEEADFVIDLEDKDYTGVAIEPSVTSDVLKADDYVVSYENNLEAGTATITITGLGNCKGEIVKTFKILKKVITADEFTVNTDDKEYTSFEICPEIITDLTEDDYTVKYSDNIEVGTATITITGAGVNCEGTVEFEFNIIPKEITEDDFSLETTEDIYTGEEFTPGVVTIFDEENYTVEYAENVNVGTATVTITGKNNLTGTVELAFTIGAFNIVDIAYEFDYEYLEVIYTGEELCPTVTAKGLVEDVDFELTYKDNIDVGVATVTITGIGNYCGEFNYNFRINRKDITEDDFTVDVTDKVYTGEEITTEIVSDLTDADYDVEYAENTNVGTATVTIIGRGNYQETLQYSFAITPKTIVGADFAVDVKDRVYTGEAQLPSITTDLVKDKDYKVVCENNINIGTATVTISGIGNYQGTITKTFKITAKILTREDFTVDTTPKTYTGSAITTEIKSSLKKDVDYKVEYENNVKAGTASIYITAIGNYQGQTFFEFTIGKKAITDADFTVDTTTKYYTGKEITTEIKSNLKKDIDYKVVYTNNVEIGQAMVSITGIGNYSGNLTKVFVIEEFICDHSTILEIGKTAATYFATGYTGDKKCGICGGLIEQGTTIAKLKLAKPKFTAKKKGNKIKVSYNKAAGVNKIQIRYRIKGKWKMKVVNAKKNTVTKTLRKLTKGKYKVQIRTMVVSGSQKVYSKWSKAQKVKI